MSGDSSDWLNGFPSDFTDQSSNHGSSSGCSLSPAGSAFSAILSALLGSVINGLTSGWLVAFATGWIAWMAIFRVLVGGVYMLYRSATNSWGPGAHKKTEHLAAEGESSGPLMGNNYAGSQIPLETYGQSLPRTVFRAGFRNLIWPPPALVRGLEHTLWGTAVAKSRNPIAKSWVDLNQDVTVLGWLGWIYGALYAPVTQIIWVTANASKHDNGTAKIVKGLTIAVTALPLCVDCRVRYADSLKWGRAVFNFTNSISCLLQGALCAFLLVRGVIDSKVGSFGGIPIPIVIIYPLFSLVWMYGSFVVLPIRDGGRKRAGETHWAGYILDIGMGAFAGLFLAAPAFALYMNAQFQKNVSGDTSSGMEDITAYLRCEGQWWKRFASVAP